MGESRPEREGGVERERERHSTLRASSTLPGAVQGSPPTPEGSGWEELHVHHVVSLLRASIDFISSLNRQSPPVPFAAACHPFQISGGHCPLYKPRGLDLCLEGGPWAGSLPLSMAASQPGASGTGKTVCG